MATRLQRPELLAPAGEEESLRAAVAAGADAVLAASVFHFRELTIRQVKAAMSTEGIPVR